jgi:hypothetical protein
MIVSKIPDNSNVFIAAFMMLKMKCSSPQSRELFCFPVAQKENQKQNLEDRKENRRERSG